GNGGGGGGNGGGGGSWQPPVPPTVPTGIPSGGPTVVPPTATIPATATSGNLVPTGPPGLPDGGSKTSGGGSNNTGAIIGGIVGGIALICLIALLFVFARRRRRREEENLAGGGAGGDHSQYEAHHGGIPPLVPIAPIGDLDEVVKKDEKETVTHGHVTPVPVPGGPSTSTETTENHHGGSVYPVPVPGGPNSDNSTNQPSGSGGVFLIGGSSSSLSTETSHHHGKDILIGSAVAGAIIGAAIIVSTGTTLIRNNHHHTTTTCAFGGGTLTPAEQASNKNQITIKLSIMRYECSDASAAIPSAAVGTVMFSKFKMLAASDVNTEDTAYLHVEETKAPMPCCTLKWMKTEFQWKRKAGMLQHLKSDRYITDLYTLYSLPAFAEYRYVSVLGSFSCTLESYMLTQKLDSLLIHQLTLVLSDALHWCHDHHVVHLNVHPSSFYLSSIPSANGTNTSNQLIWKLWNFDHARFVGESVDTAAMTMTYAAPKIWNGHKSKTDSDVQSAVSMDHWSLGLILYKLHVGKPYFVNAVNAELQLTTDEVAHFQVHLDSIKEQDAKVTIRGLLEVDIEKHYTHETLHEVIGTVTAGNGVKVVDSGSGSGSGSEESSASSSVLVLGKTQAGKSTFIKFVKNYADQQYTIDERLLGTRIKSKTQMPVPFVVKTDLQSYEVIDATGTRIDIGSLGDKYQDPDDYVDALNDRNMTLKPVSHNPVSSLPPRHVQITFLDTPGVEDTNGRDAEHAVRIIDAMTEMKSFNLIIIIITCKDPPSKAHQLAFNYYSRVIQTFQDHHSNIVFLYMHVEYEKCHHHNANHLSLMELRHKAFSQLLRCQGSYNLEDVSKAAIELYPIPAVVLDTSPSNLQRIRNIIHPDELNQAQRKRLLEISRMILKQGQGLRDCSYATMISSEGSNTHEGSASTQNAGDEDGIPEKICY
ncbi:hypothetical protein CPC16_004874, partial [Podila verticillata]